MTFLDNNLHSFVALNIFAVSFIFPDKLYCISIFKKIIKKKKKTMVKFNAVNYVS